jgi:hypothetical protein
MREETQVRRVLGERGMRREWGEWREGDGGKGVRREESEERRV